MALSDIRPEAIAHACSTSRSAGLPMEQGGARGGDMPAVMRIDGAVATRGFCFDLRGFRERKSAPARVKCLTRAA